jgi:mRNA interferase HigB
VIRPLRAGLEGFFEKNGKKLPVAGQCLRMAMGTVAFSQGVLKSPKMGGCGMRVIAKSSLVKFWSQPEFSDSKGALQSWFDEAIKADWKTPQNIKDQYSHASICANNRVVFNVAGNKYRLVVEVQYRAGIVWVKFVGTHARYDQINVESVNEY